MSVVRVTGMRTGMRFGALAATAAAALLGIMLLEARQAKAFHLSCGQTVTGTVQLDSNLTNCPGDGLRVGGPNTTIDLNGFTIDGTSNDDTDGISNGTGHPGLTVINGTIQQFENGIGTDGAGGRFSGLRVRNNLDDGFRLAGEPVDRNSIVQNTVTGNGDNGIEILEGDNNAVDLNTVTGNGINGGGSFRDGIQVGEGANGNRVTRNMVSASFDDGIAVEDNSDNNQIVGNQSNANRGQSVSDGISVSGDSDNNIVDTNTTNNNRDDGIDVDNSSTTITRNTARNNDDWGIEAVAGVTHSGNRASGNGQLGQCLNVTCTA